MTYKKKKKLLLQKKVYINEINTLIINNKDDLQQHQTLTCSSLQHNNEALNGAPTSR